MRLTPVNCAVCGRDLPNDTDTCICGWVYQRDKKKIIERDFLEELPKEQPPKPPRTKPRKKKNK